MKPALLIGIIASAGLFYSPDRQEVEIVRRPPQAEETAARLTLMVLRAAVGLGDSGLRFALESNRAVTGEHAVTRALIEMKKPVVCSGAIEDGDLLVKCAPADTATAGLLAFRQRAEGILGSGARDAAVIPDSLPVLVVGLGNSFGTDAATVREWQRSYLLACQYSISGRAASQIEQNLGFSWVLEFEDFVNLTPEIIDSLPDAERKVLLEAFESLRQDETR